MDPKLNLKTVLGLHRKWVYGEDGGSRANLIGANLIGADLSRAYLSRADLSRADLSRAYLSRADLSGADLSRADLSGADLSRANLIGADLSGAYLSGANLSRANGAELALAMASHLPEGPFIGWKMCKGGIIVKLRIPGAAKRSHGASRKCRAEFADVLEVFGAEVGISQHDGKTEYRPGKRVRCDNWDDDRWNECSGGIHFFITRIEAENYR